MGNCLEGITTHCQHGMTQNGKPRLRAITASRGGVKRPNRHECKQVNYIVSFLKGGRQQISKEERAVTNGQ